MSERNKRQGKIPYYGATGQAGWIDGYIFDEELVLLGEDGVPFLDHSKNKAYLILGKSWVNNHAHVLRAISTVLSNKFLHYFLNQFNYHGFVTGTTRLKLNQSQMKTIPVLIPPINEQHRIVSKIESILARIDACRQKLLALQERTQSGQVSSKQQILNPKYIVGSDAPSRARQLLKTNDILFSTVRTYLKNIAIVSSDLEGHLASTGFCVIRSKINSRLVFYYVQTKRFLDSLNRVQRGTSYPAVRNNDVVNMIIPIPPLSEQHRIVSRLESILSGIDAVEKQVNNSLVRLGQLKQSVLRKAFEGKLVQQDPNDEPASILLEKIKRQGSDTRVKDKFVNLSHKLGQNRF